MADAQVWFVSAGPGDPELITVKGRRFIEEADCVIYAGSLVPRELVACAKDGAEVYDSAPMTLEETHAIIREAVAQDKKVVRVHTGDAGLYGAVREQARLLDADGISWAVLPGVTAAFAGAAAAGMSFTVPENTQSLIITRLEGRTPVPEREKLRKLASHGCSMAIYLSSGNPEGVQEELQAGGLDDETPVVLAYRVGWPQQTIVRSTLGKLAATAHENNFTRQTVFLIFPGEDGEDHISKLYDEGFSHGFRA
ncbi:precorrin-4 C(11)-methyltransferase [Desulfobaculum bizertense]|uniref:precorrin-4 C(11)-methyltransferase n=1 Tax=Desulfobaculum bizertense TaxID=376490 RepID=UPI001EED0B9C|nr:precorrin-4 C(11)-methyltransferase [Desulfobaculum bizertense]UIJ37224.1 precorrin-4 C(11)-methyltransferase [Desulfobaculum bizertense]